MSSSNSGVSWIDPAQGAGGITIPQTQEGRSGSAADVVYSVVVPVFNESSNVEELVARTSVVLSAQGSPYEILFVDDGSTDGTADVLRQASRRDHHVRAVRLARNFGQEIAVQAGYWHARGSWIIQMDGDLQNPPEEIPKLLACREGDWDIVYGLRAGRRDPLFRRAASRGMRWVMRRMLGIELPPDISTFRLMRGQTAKLLASLPEKQKFLSALACWVGARYTTVDVRHEGRASGRSKYSFGRLAVHTFDLVVGFSSKPLRLIGILGLLVALFGFGVGVWAVVKRLVWGTGMGWASVFSAIVGLGGMQLLALSVIGEYVARIFAHSQQRPNFVVAEHIGEAAEDVQPPVPGAAPGPEATRG